MLQCHRLPEQNGRKMLEFDYKMKRTRELVACVPNLTVGTIFDSLRFVTEGRAMIGFPLPSNPSPAPRIKST